MKLLHVVGARPNFPKLAPVHRAAQRAGLEQVILHTGQHYDETLSDTFFSDLEIPRPTVNLDVGSGSQAMQTARVMERIEPVLKAERADWVLVYGDVNSTVAAALVAAKLLIPLAHVEAGLRSYDRTMPEEINRIVTDRLADLLLTPSRDADAILRAEGEPDDEIAFVGNVMIDTLVHALPMARRLRHRDSVRIDSPGVIVTLHRPSNVDDPARLAAIMAALRMIAKERPVIFPAHPRTASRLVDARVDSGDVRLLAALPYLEMVNLVDGAHAVITDSGGIQEETTALGVPCFTVRENTERPVTIREGTNRLVPNPADLPELVRSACRRTSRRTPEGWDGHAAERIVQILLAREAPRAPKATG